MCRSALALSSSSTRKLAMLSPVSKNCTRYRRRLSGGCDKVDGTNEGDPRRYHDSVGPVEKARCGICEPGVFVKLLIRQIVALLEKAQCLVDAGQATTHGSACVVALRTHVNGVQAHQNCYDD